MSEDFTELAPLVATSAKSQGSVVIVVLDQSPAGGKKTKKMSWIVSWK